MVSTQVDFLIKATNLKETIRNLNKLQREWFFQLLEKLVKEKFKLVKNSALGIIQTGHDMPFNVGKYAANKAAGRIFKQSLGTWVSIQPTTHPLGRLTEGGLFDGVFNTPMGSLIVSGDEANLETIFTDPYYIDWVHNGKPGVFPRPFIDKAAEEIQMLLETQVGNQLAIELEDFTYGGIDTPSPHFETKIRGEQILIPMMDMMMNDVFFTI